MNLMNIRVGQSYIISHIDTDDEELNAFLFSLGCYSGEGNGSPLQYSYPENSMVRAAWWATCSSYGLKESDETGQLTL